LATLAAARALVTIERKGTAVTPRQERGAGLRHVPALDGLRGIAVIGVLLFHAGHLIGGYLGVDMFFVLSGFLITSLLLAEWQRSGTIKLGVFWARRARRLLPALFGVLVGVALYAAVFAAPSELSQIRGDGLATLAYVANWRAILAGNSYWAQFAAPSPLAHTWSLAIEEQFYLVWPLLIFGLLSWRRGSARAVTFTSISLAAASAAWMAIRYVPNTDPSRVYIGTDTRASSVLVGAALAAFIAWKGPISSRRNGALAEAAGWFAVAGLAMAWATVPGQTNGLYEGGLLLCSLAVVAVIASVCRPTPGPLAAVLSLAPLRALGMISYGVYLWHWPVYVFLTTARTDLGGWALVGTRLAFTLCAAVLSFYLIEKPVREGALRRWRVMSWAPAAAVATALAVIFATAGATSAVAFPLVARDALPLVRPAAGLTTLLVEGDSVAASLATGLKSFHEPWQVQTLNRAVIACQLVPLRGVDLDSAPASGVPACDTEWAGDVQGYHPRQVVVAVGNVDWSRRDATNSPCEPVYDATYRDKLSGGLRALGSTGAHVAVATVSYPSGALAGTFDPALIRKRVDCINSVDRAVAADLHARVVDLNGFVCPRGVCRRTDQGAALRPDGVHFSQDAGLSVGHFILASVFGPAKAPSPSK
jgi:peptidoglycan/LPS O-acetylase OafA/YrhL